MITLISIAVTLAGIAFGGWRWFSNFKASQQYRERLEAEKENFKGVKDAVNVVQKHEADKRNSTDIDNLNGL